MATHILGDDFSLLSRQRDEAPDGVSYMRAEMADADFRTLLDAFNGRWVVTARFFSTSVLIELLRITGRWTADYYGHVDPNAPGEAVGLFGASQEQQSPFWQAIAGEYLERWIHHSQIRRALGQDSLAEHPFLVAGVEVAAAMAKMEPTMPSNPDGDWGLGLVVLGPAQQTADIPTRGRTAVEIQRLARGPEELVQLLAAVAARP